MFLISVTLSPATSQRQTALPFSVDISLTKIFYANKIELCIALYLLQMLKSLLHSCFTWWLMYLEDHFPYFRQLSTSRHIEAYISFFFFVYIILKTLLLLYEWPPDQEPACFSDMICGYKWYSDIKCVLALTCNVGGQQWANGLEWDR